MTMVDVGDADPKLVLAIAAALAGTDYDSLNGVLAMPIADAADAVGTSRDTIEKALRRGELRAAYPTSKPTIPVRYLKDWLFSLPDERP